MRKIVAKTDKTITVNVGISSNTSEHRFVSATANAVNWAHNIKIGNTITLDDQSLTWTCASDGNATQLSHPRSTDPYYQKNILITNVNGNVITMNVLDVNYYFHQTK